VGGCPKGGARGPALGQGGGATLVWERVVFGEEAAGGRGSLGVLGSLCAGRACVGCHNKKKGWGAGDLRGQRGGLGGEFWRLSLMT